MKMLKDIEQYFIQLFGFNTAKATIITKTEPP